ncbi:MAG TPA: bifunctional 3-phosphoshikimate 1-carboxyvinyltransferase/cytidylate kinase [Burkholderiaceae bacterium]|nr:bifunctional 3-phosphoshikimate 1-carboxyvinyltransferase/cytidylate kinase [Burkholderiaceae bacterium]
MYATAFLDLPPLTSAGGTVTLPGSKSISNRVLLLAALCEGTTTVHDLLDSDDTRVMLAALRDLGCAVEGRPGQPWTIQGLGGRLPVKQADLFLGNAGTAMRPLTAALALLASVHGGEFMLRGIPRMHERPIGDLADALRGLGCPVEHTGQPGYPPLRIGHGQAATLALDHPIRVRGDVSSQFLTALLLALPLVATERAIHIDVVGELISKPYIDITLKLLARFGVQVVREDWRRFTIPAGSAYRSPGSIHVEGDASSASYFIALGALSESAGGQKGIRIQGVGADSIQGDIRFAEAAAQMGARITSGPNWLQVERGAWPLKAVTLDCNHIPDAAMTLAVMALYAQGTTRLTNIASWRVKETDRIVAMARELRKLGATVEEGPDFITVTPPATPADWRAASIHTYDDHRVAMCFSLAAFNPAGVPVRIEDPKCVAKTFPDYFEALFSVTHTAAANIPVLCIDGPTASGKGTLAHEVAQRLGYHVLDSGALYRLVGIAAQQAGLSTEPTDLAEASHAEALVTLARQMDVRFADQRIWLGEQDVTDTVRSEWAGMAASRVSALPGVRDALLQLQRDFRRLPGLVADGRDMGTVVFADAHLKVYLTASASQRAQRRHQQLLERGQKAILQDLLQALEQRDRQDQTRQHAPLKPAEDARLLDNSAQTIEESVAQVLDWWQGKQPFGTAY